MVRGMSKLVSLSTLLEQRLASSGALLAPQCSSTAQQWLRPAAALQQSAWFATDQFRKQVQNAGPGSLEFQRQPPEEVQQEQQRGFAVKALLTLGGYYSRESRHMRAAQRLYAAVAEQATSPAFLEAAGIPDNFQQLHSSLCLHVWLLLVRLRAEGKEGKHLAQVLYDDFQSDVEERARKAGVRVRLSKQLTELEKQFYGSSMAYDKAMGVGESSGEPLHQALYRNVYLMEDGKQEDAQLLARYVRRELACLTQTPSQAVMAGNLRFSTEGLQTAAAAAAGEAAPSNSSSGSGASPSAEAAMTAAADDAAASRA